MKIDGALLDYLYNRDRLYKGILSCLRIHFNINSEADVKSFYAFLMTKQISADLTQDELENYYAEWKECAFSSQNDIKGESYLMELNNVLSTFYNQKTIVPRDEVLEKTWSTLSSGRDSSSLLYLCVYSVQYHRVLLNWKMFNQRDILECNAEMRSAFTKSAIQSLSSQAKLIASMSKWDDRDYVDGFLRSFLSKGVSVDLKNYILAYYGNGFVFDDKDPISIANAISYLSSFGLPIIAVRNDIKLLIQAAAYKGIKTKDPFLNYEIITEINKVFSDDDVTNEIEPTSNPKNNSGIKFGRRKGCWLLSDNVQEEAVWGSVIRNSIWGKLMEEMGLFEFPQTMTPKKIQSTQVLLAASIIYRAAVDNKIAKPDSDGCRTSFARTLSSCAKFNEEKLLDYLKMLSTWKDIESKRHELAIETNEKSIYDDYESRETGRLMKQHIEDALFKQYRRSSPELCNILESNYNRIGPVLSFVKKKLDRGNYLNPGAKESIDN